MESTSMTSKYMSFSPQLVNERNTALNNCPTKSGRSQIYKIYYIKMKDAYKKYEEAIEDDEEDYEEDDDDDDEDYEPSEDEEYEEEYEESEDEDEEESACEREVPDQDANACETEADQEYCCCCEAAYANASEADEAEAYEEEACACETEEAASEAEASEAEASEAEASEADEAASACETEEANENEFGCPGCNYEWRDGYKNGWRDAMKYITGRTHKKVPDTPACSYCDIVCKTRKCSGKCGGVVRYCSVDCQKQDWAFGHKNICGK
jgi:hypothetical protein